VGLTGEAKTDVHATGQVFVHGEYWNARSDEPVSKGDRVKVTAVDGLTLTVKKA
jgi:membrane-bound serine protease (ClpP class)